MAFGFGFNKQKVLSAAEKCVQQGKLQNAISEYEKILKHDAKDLTVMNTIGDLYARLGQNDKAAECFKNVGDAYASQGFTVKAIAMYKKLSKIKASMESVLRLAELYTQQGLFNDARAQYLLVAEDFLKTGQLDQAVRIFEKTLEMDPENIAMRTKLAEVYIRLNKKDDAWKLLSAAAESLRAKGQLAAADEILQRMLKLDPASGYALAMRGKSALDAGDAKAAIESLSKIPDLDTNLEALRALFNAYLKEKMFAEAGPLAAKLASVHNDNTAIAEYAEALLGTQDYRGALKIYEEHADDLLRSDPGKFSESLRTIIGHIRDDFQSLETLLALYEKTGETTHLSEIYELLAHAYVQSGHLDKARALYSKLMQMEPANQMHSQNHQQVLEKLGTNAGPHPITSEEGSALVDELEATAPFIEQRYPDEIALAVRSALTDAELFASYNMAPKAMEPLLNALPKAPRDLRLNQKLAALHTKAGRFAEAAVCCRTLESIYHDAGYNEEARRYGDVAAKYEERSGTAAPAATVEPAASAAPEFEIAAPVSEFTVSDPTATSEPAASEAAVEATPVVQATTHAARPARSGLFFHGANAAPRVSVPAKVAPEPEVLPVKPTEETPTDVDLAGEWENDLSVEVAPESVEPAQTEAQPIEIDSFDTAEAEVNPEPQTQPELHVAPAPDLSEGIEEVRFYLGQGMIDHAGRVLAKLEALAPESPELAVLRLGVDSAKQTTADPEPEVSIQETAQVEDSAPVQQAPATLHSTPQPWPKEPPRVEPERPVLQEMVTELEQSLGDGFGPGTAHEAAASAPIEAAPQALTAPATEPQSKAEPQFRSGSLDEFVSDLEASLGNDFLADAAPETPAGSTMQSADLAAPPAVTAHVPPAAASAMPVARAAAASAASHIPVNVAPASASAGHSTAGVTESAGVDLANMFGELKHELEEETTATDEDPETHYNLGVAFREMGLLDEAIGEFQKVCQSAGHGHVFPQIMQTYTWLAQCFLDKGVPEAAIRWYEQALKIPSIDQETRTALHYELASSFETAGDKPAALNNFLQVYSSNIDYRDVAERIKALRT